MFKDLKQFFSYMNDTNFEYVVLRNWDNLPYDVKVGPHSDLDILVYDFDHFKEFMGDHIEVVHELPRVQHKILLEGGDYVLLDVRHLGDNYYPKDFELNILKSKEWNSRGFYTPSPTMFRIALAYHAVHHKNRNKYENKLGRIKIPELLEALKKSKVGWVRPNDPTVGDHNAYYRGATSLVSSGNGTYKKEQVRFKEHDLIANEVRMLKLLNNHHFPKLLSHDKDSLTIEDCGKPLTLDNLPDDWREQMIEIVTELDRYKIVHRDIRQDNFMVKDNNIMLIDFGWARLEDEEDGEVPDLLGYPNKYYNGFSDVYSIRKVMKQITAELEELNENTVS